MTNAPAQITFTDPALNALFAEADTISDRIEAKIAEGTAKLDKLKVSVTGLSLAASDLKADETAL